MEAGSYWKIVVLIHWLRCPIARLANALPVQIQFTSTSPKPDDLILPKERQCCLFDTWNKIVWVLFNKGWHLRSTKSLRSECKKSHAGNFALLSPVLEVAKRLVSWTVNHSWLPACQAGFRLPPPSVGRQGLFQSCSFAWMTVWMSKLSEHSAHSPMFLKSHQTF